MAARSSFRSIHGAGRFGASPTVGHNSRPGRPPVTYAIAFDLDTATLQQLYPSPSWNNAYADIRRFLEDSGFVHKQGSVYFGDESIDAVSCVLVAQRLSAEFDWFQPSVSDIRMLRIEDNNDLMSAIGQRPGPGGQRRGK